MSWDPDLDPGHFHIFNKDSSHEWFIKATLRARQSTQSESAFMAKLKHSVRLIVAFCLTCFCARQVVVLPVSRSSILSSKSVCYFFKCFT